MEDRGAMAGVLGLLFITACAVNVEAAWGFNSDSVLLKDIEVLTLYSGKMTAGGRSAPVPQLDCVKGGTAPCDAFRPRVVQCYNRGWDGVDVQWECKSDMDNAFRFGEIEVSCEGYSHRDDPYILKGSCGLRYSIDYTKEGLNQQKHQHSYYGGESSDYNYQGYASSHERQSKVSFVSYLADVIVWIAVALMCWAFYKTCFGSSRRVGEDARSTTNDDYPAGGGGGGYGWFGQGGGGGGAYPPNGHRPEYRDDANCRNRTNGGAGGGGGGFWTGAAAGGLLGYMFGNRQGHGGGYGYTRRPGGWSTGWGGGGYSAHHSGGGGGGFSGGGGGGSTGTRTASGFGGTSRR